jgi:hypothetical protein
MGWDGIGDTEAAKVLDVTRANLEAVLAVRGRKKP